MDEVSKQLKKGILEILILKFLSLEPMYGYQLIQFLDTRSGGIFKMKEGTLYPILYRLEDHKFIESYWEQDGEKRGVPRKYYRITPSGTGELLKMSEELAVLMRSVDSILELEEI